ncbi:MAG TPA: hypothetical protein PKD61_10555 [Polyangiaceae bacterium]|nr:hypothetical protein [Polyangiaceae bacterium]
MIGRSLVILLALGLCACGGVSRAPGASEGDARVLEELSEATWYYGNHSAAGFGDEEWWDFSQQSGHVAGRFRHYVSVGEVSEQQQQATGEFRHSGRQVEVTWAEALSGVERVWFTVASFDTWTRWDGTNESGLWLSTQGYAPFGGGYRSRYGLVADGKFEETTLTLTVWPALSTISNTTACNLKLSFAGAVGADSAEQTGTGSLSYAATCTPRGARYVDIRASELTLSEWYNTAKDAATDAGSPEDVAQLFGRVYASVLQYDRSRNLVFNAISEHSRERSVKAL